MIFVLLSVLYVYDKAKIYGKPLFQKWVKGECRHLCLFCKHFDICKTELWRNPDYDKGFEDGYKAGKDDAIREIRYAYKYTRR